MIKDSIRRERNKLKYTQKQLADLLNVSQQTVGSWEVGRTEPDSNMLIALSKIFDVSIDYLTNNQKPNKTLPEKHLANTLDSVSNELGDDVSIMFKDINNWDEDKIKKLKTFYEMIKDEKI